MILNQNKMTTRWAGSVRRYHTWPVIRHQTIADHTWNVLRMYYEIFGELPENVAVYILYHDVPEIKVGDPPYPIKKNNPALKEIMDRLEADAMREFGIKLPWVGQKERNRIKICDALDCWEYAREEMAMGNSTFQIVIDRIKQLFVEMEPLFDTQDIIKLDQYFQANGLEGVYQ